MKKYLVILGLVFCANCFADILPEGFSGHYMIDHVINETSVPVYHLRQAEEPKGEHIYGTQVIFDPDSGTFSSFYTAWCGNDCFPLSEGTYTMESEHRIRLHLTHISQDGGCENYEKDVQQDLGVFLIETNEVDGSMTLTAVDVLSQ